MRNEVIQQVTKIMHKYTETRDNNLREATTKISCQITDSRQEMERYKINCGSTTNSILSEDKELLTRMEKKANDARRARDSSSRILETLTTNIQTGVQQVSEHTAAAVRQHQSTLEQDTGALDAAAYGAFDRLDRGRKLRLEELQAIRTDATQIHGDIQTSMSSMTDAISTTMGDVLSSVRPRHRPPSCFCAHWYFIQTRSFSEGTKTFCAATGQQLGALTSTTKSLAHRAIAEDTPTGTTPKKRKWEYEDEWDVVADRATAIKQWREKRAPLTNSEPVIEEVTSATTPSTAEEPGYVDYEVPLAVEDEDEDEEDVEIAAPTLSPEPAPALAPKPAVRSKSLAALVPGIQRRTNAPPVTHPAAGKPTGIARVSKRVASGSGAVGSAGVPRSSSALVEKSNAAGRRRDKV